MSWPLRSIDSDRDGRDTANKNTNDVTQHPPELYTIAPENREAIQQPPEDDMTRHDMTAYPKEKNTTAVGVSTTSIGRVVDEKKSTGIRR